MGKFVRIYSSLALPPSSNQLAADDEFLKTMLTNHANRVAVSDVDPDQVSLCIKREGKER